MKAISWSILWRKYSWRLFHLLSLVWYLSFILATNSLLSGLLATALLLFLLSCAGFLRQVPTETPSDLSHWSALCVRYCFAVVRGNPGMSVLSLGAICLFALLQVTDFSKDLAGWVVSSMKQLEGLSILHYGLEFGVPMLVVFVVGEYLKARHLYNLKEALSSFLIGTGALLIRFITTGLEFALYVSLFNWALPFRQDFLGYSSLGFSLAIWLVCILADDHNFYWHHRLMHNIRVLWAAHLPHHSGRGFNLSVGLRNGWFTALFKPIYWMWMPLVGFEPTMILSCIVVSAFYQFFLHTQLLAPFGWIRSVFNTPELHLVHHSWNTEYLDRNHGGIFSIWDRLYGTWQVPIRGVAPKFGISHGPDTNNPVSHILFEYMELWRDVQRAPSIRSKLMYIFGPPGWSHDGLSKTSRQLQEELAQARLKNSGHLDDRIVYRTSA